MAGVVPIRADQVGGEPPVGDPIAAPASAHDRHFSTDHLMVDLKGHTARASAVSLTAQGVKFVLQVGSTMVLARLLTPGDFGLVAMVTAVIGLLGVIKDAGLSMATVQRKVITHDQVSTLLWLNVGLSLVLAMLTTALAPAIVALYDEPRLYWITIVLSLSFIFSGLTVQHQALLRRQMRFTALAAIEVISLFCGVASAIVIALLTRSFWALVALPVMMAITNASAVWLTCDWRPGRPVRGSGVIPLIMFGRNMALASLLNYSSRTADNILLGAVWGPGVLGVYSKAYNLLLLPFRQVNSPMAAALLPALSRSQNDPQTFRSIYLNGIRILALIGVPVVAFVALEAHAITLILLGEGWEAAIPVFRAAAPFAFLETMSVVSGWALVPYGRTATEARLTMYSSATLMMGMLAGLPWGATGVALGLSTASLIKFVPISIIATRHTPVRLRDILRVCGIPWMAALMAAAAVQTVRQFIDKESFLLFLLYGFLFSFVYAFTCYRLNPVLFAPRRLRQLLWQRDTA